MTNRKLHDWARAYYAAQDHEAQDRLLTLVIAALCAALAALIVSAIVYWPLR